MPKPQLRADQGWIFDNFLMLSDNEDVLHPGIMGNRLERGTKFEDLHAVFGVPAEDSYGVRWRLDSYHLEGEVLESIGALGALWQDESIERMADVCALVEADYPKLSGKGASSLA